MIGCSTGHQLSQGRAFRLKPVEWNQLQGWKKDDLMAAMPALRKSCTKATSMFESFCRGLSSVKSESELRTHVEKYLQPYLVQSYGKETGKITGYYEAELKGSRQQRSNTQFPIYGLPNGYTRNQSYPTRESIYKKGINAPIIAWADSEIDLFILHVQGSGRKIKF